MDKSLEEFYGAATLSTEKWSGGSVSDYVATGSEEPQTATIVKALKAETLGILKSNNEGADNDMKIEDINFTLPTAEIFENKICTIFARFGKN